MLLKQYICPIFVLFPSSSPNCASPIRLHNSFSLPSTSSSLLSTLLVHHFAMRQQSSFTCCNSKPHHGPVTSKVSGPKSASRKHFSTSPMYILLSCGVPSPSALSHFENEIAPSGPTLHKASFTSSLNASVKRRLETSMPGKSV